MIDDVRATLFDLDSILCRHAITVDDALAHVLEPVGLAQDEPGPMRDLAEAYSAPWSPKEDASRESSPALRRRGWASMLCAHVIEDSDDSPRTSEAHKAARQQAGLTLLDGVTDLLHALRAHARLAILTNGPSDRQRTKLRELSLADTVDATRLAGDVGAFKPDPRPFLHLLDLLEIRPEQALLVGDSYEHDIVGARGGGMWTAWVAANESIAPDEGHPDWIMDRVIGLREVFL